MWPNPHETEDLVTFTEEMLNGKLQFLCRDICIKMNSLLIQKIAVTYKYKKKHAENMVKTVSTSEALTKYELKHWQISLKISSKNFRMKNFSDNFGWL